MKKECPKCHKLKRFYYEICGECRDKENKKLLNRSPNKYGYVVRRVVNEYV
jgi:hypothetical protein